MSATEQVHITYDSVQGFFQALQKLAASYGEEEIVLRILDFASQPMLEERGIGESVAEKLAQDLGVLQDKPFRRFHHAAITDHFDNQNRPNLWTTFKLMEADGRTMPVDMPRDVDRFDDIHSCFSVVSVQEAGLEKIQSHTANRLHDYDRAIAALLQTAANTAQAQLELKSDLAEFFTKSTKELAEVARQRETEFDAHRREIEDALADQQRKLDDERAALRLQESRDVRRDLYDKARDMISLQKTEPSSSQAVRSSWGAIIASSVAIAIGLAIIGVTFNLTYNGVADANTTFFLVPFVSGTLVTVTSIIVLFRQMLSTARRNADRDLAIQQFDRDMMRMSWIAELLFEAKTHHVGEERQEVAIPESLLEQFANSLFRFGGTETPEHPIDDLQRLTRRFKKFTIGRKGIEVESHDEKSKPQ